jgi:hypothetical protein
MVLKDSSSASRGHVEVSHVGTWRSHTMADRGSHSSLGVTLGVQHREQQHVGTSTMNVWSRVTKRPVLGTIRSITRCQVGKQVGGEHKTTLPIKQNVGIFSRR